MSSASQMLYGNIQGRIYVPERPPVEFVELGGYSWANAASMPVTTPKDPTITTTYIIMGYRQGLTVPAGWTLEYNQYIDPYDFVGIALISYPGVSPDVTLTQSASGTFAAQAVGYKSESSYIITKVVSESIFLGAPPAGGALYPIYFSKPSVGGGCQIHAVRSLYTDTSTTNLEPEFLNFLVDGSNYAPPAGDYVAFADYAHTHKTLGGAFLNNGPVGTYCRYEFKYTGEMCSFTVNLY